MKSVLQEPSPLTSNTPKTCNICHSNRLEFLLGKRAGTHLNLDVVYRIVQCKSCNSAFVENPPRPEELSVVYDRHFFSTSQQDAPIDTNGKFTPDASKRPIIRNARERVATIRRLTPAGRLADIGCGKGFFLKVASDYYDTVGFELSHEAAEFGQTRLDLDIRCGDFEQASLSGEVFDVVTLWDVLASLYDPCEGIEQASSILKNSGYLVMTVPDIDSLSFRLSKKSWPLLIPPINLWYFSRASIAILLEQHGFQLYDWRHDSKWVSSNFVLRKFGRITGLSLLDNDSVSLPFFENLRLNLFDIATVVARKLSTK